MSCNSGFSRSRTVAILCSIKDDQEQQLHYGGYRRQVEEETQNNGQIYSLQIMTHDPYCARIIVVTFLPSEQKVL